jgi:hypothetical protein
MKSQGEKSQFRGGNWLIRSLREDISKEMIGDVPVFNFIVTSSCKFVNLSLWLCLNVPRHS